MEHQNVRRGNGIHWTLLQSHGVPKTDLLFGQCCAVEDDKYLPTYLVFHHNFDFPYI